MKAEIIAVGSELLLGEIANTNAQYLSEWLASCGIDVHYHSVVGDNEARMTDVFKQAQARADLLVITGGLGPTEDDLTKEVLAKLLGRRLQLDEASAGQPRQQDVLRHLPVGAGGGADRARHAPAMHDH